MELNELFEAILKELQYHSKLLEALNEMIEEQKNRKMPDVSNLQQNVLRMVVQQAPGLAENKDFMAALESLMGSKLTLKE
jgi:hypothetical protein